MTLSEKLAQQQQLRTRNEARFGSLPETTIDDCAIDPPASDAPVIRANLEKLRARIRRPKPEQQRWDGCAPRLNESFGGSVQSNTNGAFLRRVSHTPFGIDSQQEALWVSRLIQLLCAQAQVTDPRSIIFLDTETTGLSGGAGTVAFLVGLGRWTESGFVIEQYLMRDYHEERAMLLGLQQNIADVQLLVTFNGKAFDIPLLQSRFVLARQRWPLAEMLHLDLLHPARRLWKLRLGNCCLANLESQLFGIEREDDIPGHMIPPVYFRYVRTRNAHGIDNILSHNRQDIETLARLALRMGKIFSGQANQDLAPVDLFSAGRYAHALGERELATRWNEAALLRGLPENHELEAKKAKAARLKEQKKYSEAAELWRDLSERSEGFLEDVQEELAIYYEHRKGDLQEALSVSERALAQLQNQVTLRKWEHRRARVATKLARRTPVEPGSLFPGNVH
jgi:uncharacterized protein